MLFPKTIARTYQHLLKPILFCFRPETMHTMFGKIGRYLGKYAITRKITRTLFAYESPILSQTVWGKTYPNPVGLAAGFDKDIQLPQIIADVGFGFEEVGSITYDAYEGNPGTRLYRLKQSQGLVVNYGLKNNGVKRAMQRIASLRHVRVPLWVSIAKTNCARTCDIEQGIWDYQESLRLLGEAQLGDAYVINISCPNAFGGEDFTAPERLTQLLSALDQIIYHKPILVKLPVDAPRLKIQSLLDVCVAHGVKGVIVSNLTKVRDDIIEKDAIQDMPGGISGKPTYDKSNELIGKVYQYVQGRMIIVGVGGIFSAQDAYEKIKQGATLVQLITGMIYQGPQLIGQINAGLVKLLQADGYTHVGQAIGVKRKSEKA